MDRYIDEAIEHVSYRVQTILKGPPSPVLSVSAAVAATWAIWRLTLTRRKANTPPIVPYNIPFIGNGLDLSRDPRKFIDKCKKKYGPVFQITTFGKTMVVATGPYIQECFRLGDKYLDFTEGVEDFLPLKRIMDISYDKQQRQETKHENENKSPIVKAVRNNFKSHQLKMFEDRMQYAVDRGLELDIHFKPGSKSTTLEIDAIQQMVGRISALLFAGREVGESEELITAMATFAQSIFKAAIAYTTLPATMADFVTKNYLDISDQIDITMKHITPVLEKVKAQEDKEGQMDPDFFMHMMLHMPNADGSQPTPKEAGFWLQDIAFASIHTTSLFTTWALHLLSDRPDIQELIRQETESTKKKHGVLTPAAVKDMPIIDSIFRETLRLNGDYIGINHKAMQDTVLSNGIIIPKGKSVGMAVDDVHNDPTIQHIGENNVPLTEMDPRRFVSRKTKKSTAVGLDLLSFGLGYHACPGRYLASQEICYLLAKILEEYDISPATKDGKRARNRVAMGFLKLTPAEGVILTKRS
ncbi:cytochrome P450 [Umbelopsis sp. AD052]|nr:cytochrome P450 [Umbelopsis sp. AD052]